MKKFLVFFLIGAVSARLIDDKCEEYSERYKQVKNGGPFSEFSHIGILGFNVGGNYMDYNCPVVLISESYALAGAFCFNNRKGGGQILFGTSSTSELDDDNKLVHIVKTYYHPLYDESDLSKRYALVLIEFSPAIAVDDNVKPACIYSKTARDEQPLIDTVWRPTKYEQIKHTACTKTVKHYYNELLKLNSEVVPVKVCKNKFSPKHIRIDDSNLCIKRDYQGLFTSHPDFAGVSQLYENNKIKVVAIDDFGPLEIDGSVPDVSTRLSDYLDWIESTVWPN
nr:serine protease persephone-like [Onthophagus taurus]